MKVGRLLAGVVAVALVATACGNASNKSAKTAKRSTGGPATFASADDLKKKLPITAPGVSDSEIRVAVIASKTNPMNGHYDHVADGIQAYFDMINAGGGIYGRKLVIANNRDDLIGLQDLKEVQASLAEDNAFATFVATLQFTGADLLTQKGQPTFLWNINPEMAGHDNVFADRGAICFTCPGPNVPWLARQIGAKKAAILGYGVSKQSQDCARGNKANFAKFGIDAPVYDDTINYAEPNLSAQVSQMKDAGVQFVYTCMDINEVVVLAKEMRKQGLTIPQLLPFGYDQEYLHNNADVLDGSFVAPLYLAGEYSKGLAEYQDFQKWIQRSGKPVYEITETGWVLAHMFVDGLRLAGPSFSQQKVIDALNTQTDMSVGGLEIPIDWTTQHVDPITQPDRKGKYDCFNLVQVKGGKFVVPSFVHSDKPWICWDTKKEQSFDDVLTLSFAPQS